MMRRSGVRSRVAASKVACDTPRRAASGHIPAMQFLKLAAAARIASAVIRGWPEAPDSPLHSGVPDCDGGGGAVAWPNRLRKSKPSPATGPADRAANSATLIVQQSFDIGTHRCP